MIKYKSIIFGSIGTIVETSNIQRKSFNKAFKKSGLDWHWSVGEYKKLLERSGGENRLSNYSNKKNIKINTKLGFATSTTVTNINSIFFTLKNSINKKDFDFIGNNKFALRKKPYPDIYKITLKKLNLKSKDCLAIEDTEESMKSALKAKIRCIAFPGKLHNNKEFKGSYKIIKKLSKKNIFFNL